MAYKITEFFCMACDYSFAKNVRSKPKCPLCRRRQHVKVMGRLANYGKPTIEESVVTK